jgi:hypothetical protein
MIRIALFGCVALAMAGCAVPRTQVDGAVPRDAYGRAIIAGSSK